MNANGADSGPSLPGGANVIIVGASGDLTHKKLLPALFALYCQGFLPKDFRVFGFGRTELTHEAFRRMASEHLTCRYVPGSSCADRMAEFLSCCYYCAGEYDRADAFLDLFSLMKEAQQSAQPALIFYLAIPPSIFSEVAGSIGKAGLVACGDASRTSRVVVEKPFGRDRESSDKLGQDLAQVFTESQTYRIDHYLGKELIQNLMVLRFANRIFEPLWNNIHIQSVEILWKEDIGVEHRGGYFDNYGIIRDVVQNHLLQILALIAMEAPANMHADSIRNRKVEVLRHIPRLARDDLVIGQYRVGTLRGRRYPAYTDEANVRPGSLTPTFAAAVLRVENERWRGVPFFVYAGKGLDSRQTEIRIRFRELEERLFWDAPQCLAANELVIRVQPDEAIYFRIVNKVPGLKLTLAETSLNLRYEAAFQAIIPDAYECLLLDVMRGDKSLFIRADELAAAWDIFTPVLHELEAQKILPEPYDFGAVLPAAALQLAGKYGIVLAGQSEGLPSRQVGT